MSNINQRLLDELFLRKTSVCDLDLYFKYYGRIWPCESNFRDFLQTKSAESRIELAKQIVARLGFMANFPTPYYLFQDLIAAEHRGEDKAESGYIAQDHAVHSVNLYILGIYLYFSHKLFHDRLIRYFEGKRTLSGVFETPKECAVKSFLTSWRIFCISHDLGYVLERAADGEGRLRPESGISPQLLLGPNRLPYEILYDLVVRSLARCLYAELQFRDSSQTAEQALKALMRDDRRWCRWSGEGAVPLGPNDWTIVDSFQTHTRLPLVNSYHGLKQLLPFLQRKDILTVVKDQNLQIAALFFFHEDQAVSYFKEKVPFKLEELMELDHLGSEEFPTQGYFGEYFVPIGTSIDSKFNVTSLLPYPPQLRQIATQLRQHLGHCLSLVVDDHEAENSIYEIYRWLRNVMPLGTLGLFTPAQNGTSYMDNEKQLKKVTQDEFRQVLHETIQSILLTSHVGIDNWVKQLNTGLTKRLKDKNFTQDLSDRITRRINSDPVHSIQSILRTYLRNAIIIESDKSLLERPDLLQIENGQIMLAEHADGTAWSHLKAKLQDLTQKLDIPYDQLAGYHSNHSKYDHGVMSARLVSESYLFYQEICKRVSPLLACAWPVTLDRFQQEVIEKDDELFSESIFSIMLHNVYTPTSNTPGIDYCQDLSTNPFSYFCAFCDNLQLWDRPKLIEPAYTLLPEERYTGNDLDLKIEDNKIHIICHTKDIHHFLSKSRDDLSSFLRDAQHLILVTISEQPIS